MLLLIVDVGWSQQMGPRVFGVLLLPSVVCCVCSIIHTYALFYANNKPELVLILSAQVNREIAIDITFVSKDLK